MNQLSVFNALQDAGYDAEMGRSILANNRPDVTVGSLQNPVTGTAIRNFLSHTFGDISSLIIIVNHGFVYIIL